MTALIIKELKERKTVIIVGIVASLLPAIYALIAFLLRDSLLKSLIFPVAFLNLIILIIAFPIMVAESSVAGEVEGKTLSFLLTLPIARSKIWCAKITSCFLILYGTLLFYIILTPSLFAFARLKAPGFDSAGILLALILLIPSIILSIAFLISTMASRSMTASIGALLMVFITAFGAFLVLNGLEWTISGLELVLLACAVSFVASMTSRSIFLKAQFLDASQRLKKSLICSAAGALALGLMIASIYGCSYFFLSSQAQGFDSIMPESGSSRLLTSVVCRGFQNRRMWLLDPEGKKILKFADRRIFAPIFIDKGTIEFDKMRAFDFIYRGKVRLQHWLMDSDGRNRKLLYTSSMDMSSLGSFFSKSASLGSGQDRIFLILPWKEGNYVSIDVTILTAEGVKVKDLRLPEKIDSESSITDNSSLPDRGKKIELQHVRNNGHEGLCFVFPCVESYGERALVLDEIDLRSCKYARISRISLDDDEQCPSYEISPETGDAMALVKRHRNWQVLYFSRARKEGAWERLFETDEGPLSFPHFVGEGKSLIWVEKEGHKKQKAVIFDINDKKSTTIFEAQVIHGLFLSPGGKRVVFVTSPEAQEGSPLSLHVKELDSDSPARLIKGVTLNRSDRWEITWRHSGELIYHIWPWQIASVTFSPGGDRVQKLYPYEEEK
jgi:ABC-type transport system involved in multi-copper enzyme maturation permease subunit